MSRKKKGASASVPGVKLDLGCGKNKLEGYIGVDIRDLPGVDKVWNLGQLHWPWEDDSVDEINASYLLSYLDNEERMHFMNECCRILKKGCKLAIKVPHWSCMRSIQDPMFKGPPISETTFMSYNEGFRKANDQEHYPITADFDYGYGHAIDNETALRNDEFKQFAVTHYLNVALDLIVTMTKR